MDYLVRNGHKIIDSNEDFSVDIKSEKNDIKGEHFFHIPYEKAELIYFE